MIIFRTSDWKIAGGHDQARKPTNLLFARGNEEVPGRVCLGMHKCNVCQYMAMAREDGGSGLSMVDFGDSGVGAAIFFPSQEHQPVLLRLHPDFTAFQAELFAILCAAQIAEASPTKTSVTIASDYPSGELLPIQAISSNFYQKSVMKRSPTNILTGHVLEDISRFHPETDPTCINCSKEPQTVDQLLFSCAAFLRHTIQTAILIGLTHLYPRFMASLTDLISVWNSLVNWFNSAIKTGR
ncbi:hypothetical protein LAZ67_21002033 [Cordylochernes scorpioides]|uniref:RNase H type-1 domain-containing protein n=1 Tax=Cordylochernes scorpioides TaxID=51811 RepID=A0ABY6LRG4_9ARAC|nr:hypothetical protein LAZ67_21002033 [Cordylochernes scorpioides]